MTLLPILHRGRWVHSFAARVLVAFLAIGSSQALAAGGTACFWTVGSNWLAAGCPGWVCGTTNSPVVDGAMVYGLGIEAAQTRRTAHEAGRATSRWTALVNWLLGSVPCQDELVCGKTNSPVIDGAVLDGLAVEAVPNRRDRGEGAGGQEPSAGAIDQPGATSLWTAASSGLIFAPGCPDWLCGPRNSPVVDGKMVDRLGVEAVPNRTEVLERATATSLWTVLVNWLLGATNCGDPLLCGIRNSPVVDGALVDGLAIDAEPEGRDAHTTTSPRAFQESATDAAGY